MFLILLLNALFSVTFPLVKMGLQFARPIFFAATRMILSGFVLMTYLYFFRRKKLQIRREDIPLFAKLIIFQTYLSYISDFWALQYVSASKWAFFYTVSPFFVAFFSYRYFSENLSLKKNIGLLLCAGSFFLTLLNETSSEKKMNIFFFLSLPELAMLFSSISFAYGLVIMRHLIVKGGYSVILVNGISMLVGGIAMIMTSPFLESWYPSPIVSFIPFICILILIIVFYIVYDLLYTTFLHTYSATLLSIISLSDPLFASLYGYLMLKEAISLELVFSSCIILCGVFLFYQEEMKHRKK